MLDVVARISGGMMLLSFFPLGLIEAAQAVGVMADNWHISHTLGAILLFLAVPRGYQLIKHGEAGL